jgi:predicted patatin/cPLA2 family phospholipase
MQVTKEKILEIIAQINNQCASNGGSMGATKQMIQEEFDTPEEKEQRNNILYKNYPNYKEWAKALNFKNEAYKEVCKRIMELREEKKISLMTLWDDEGMLAGMGYFLEKENQGSKN